MPFSWQRLLKSIEVEGVQLAESAPTIDIANKKYLLILLLLLVTAVPIALVMADGDPFKYAEPGF